MSVNDDGNQNTQSAKVLQLGFNISVSGDPGTDFQIVLDDAGQKAVQSTLQNETCLPSSGILPKSHTKTQISKEELEVDIQEVESADDTSVKLNSSSYTKSLQIGQKAEGSASKESNLINEIRSTIEHFEKFSEHFKEVPRLRSHPTATSTPILDKNNSKSESNLICPEFRARRFSHLYDYHYRKNNYFNKPTRPPDLFLKPLPGENFYKSGFYSRYKTDSLRQYVSDISLNKTPGCKAVCEKSKDDFALDTPGILKKSDNESGDKQSTSSAESTKDIKIYQSGGILIMQNFKENMDSSEKKEISDFSAKLIENCSRLREEVNSFQENCVKEMGFTSEEGRNSGKVVQFDLSGFDSQKSKSGDSSLSASKDEKLPLKQGSSDSITDSNKNKDSSPPGMSQCQDFPSLSTVENESIISNQLGMSPTYSSAKKLEWDSGADVGYYNSDPSKENLSAIEKYVLSHLSSGDLADERKVQPDISKFAQVRIASDKLMEDIREERKKEQEIIVTEKRKKEKNGSRSREFEAVEPTENPVKSTEVRTSKDPHQLEKLKLVKDSPIQKQFRPQRRAVESIDKSVSVNTLFENKNFNLPHRNVTADDYRKVEIPNKRSPKFRKFRKSKPSPRKSTWAPQKRRFSLESINNYYDRPFVEMGIPKRTYRKVDGNPEIKDVELSREVEEIVIDQRFKIKQNISSAKESKKSSPPPEPDSNEKENKPKRPVSGSSSSNNTVLPNIENKETENKKTVEFTDQVIQTVGLDCESVGVQAFESQMSSYNSRKENGNPKAQKKADNVYLCSKNIQAFGLNASLPKELAHPKEMNFSQNQHTKGTQFFGGPINSLPNYHASLLTKPGESCSRAPKFLKTKKTPEGEIIRVDEVNKEKILKGDSQKTNSKGSGAKNKENALSKSHSSIFQKTKDASNAGKKDTDSLDLKSKKHSPVMEDPDYPHTSDEVSSKVLTSEVLKEHGDSIDRNIIQEKYFQSQLIELKKREMVSRSTSMGPPSEEGRGDRECVNVGCQYSLRSRDTTSEEESKDQMPNDDFKEKSKTKNQRTETTDQYDSSQNIVEEDLVGTSKSTNQEQITGESLPSSTQTANSWIPGVQNPEQDKSGVGRARSFEYLPGHIYESSGNLREELPSETEQNLITSSSSESDSGKNSENEDAKDSEGRNTLILENSTDNSHESDQLKILGENLTQLNLVVSKLWEKEAAVKNLTQSFLLNLLRKNGSGDYLGQSDTLQTEVLHRKSSADVDSESGDGPFELNAYVKKKTKEITIGCQTVEKSSSTPEKFYDERKVLEKRINEEKQSQIKWIENEIRHLNLLRQLLEKESFSHRREKRHSLASKTSNGVSKIDAEQPDADVNENYSGSVTPVYGCTISLARNSVLAENPPMSEETSSRNQPERVNTSHSDPVHYGMSVSLRNVAVDAVKNVPCVVTLPLGVQISLKDSKEKCSNSDEENGKITKIRSRSNSSCRKSPTQKSIACRPCRPQIDVCTQYPSSRRNSLNLPSTSVQTDFNSGKCRHCQRKSCFCLSLSERSLQSPSRSSKVSAKKECSRHCVGEEKLAGDNKTSSSTDPELLELGSYTPPKVVMKSDRKSDLSFSKPRCTFKDDSMKQLEQRPCSKSSVRDVILQNPCESNGTSTSDNSDDVFSCHCSKVHVKKYSTCSCQIIKIIGAKCSTGSGTHRCGKHISKATENQACQTDQVTIVSKDLVPSPELIQTKAKDMEYLCEEKIAMERKATVLQKLPNEPKVSIEKRQSCDKKLEVVKKLGVVKRSPEVDVPVEEKTMLTVSPGGSFRKVAVKEGSHFDEKGGNSPENVSFNAKAMRGDRTCTCFESYQNETDKDYTEEVTEDERFNALGKKPSDDFGRYKQLQKKTAEDDHPRHYFLKIEETEVEDSCESLEMKNSVEIITVKIPVKKAGKGKIYNQKPYQITESKNSRKEAPKRCDCCQACGGFHQKSVEFSTSDEFRRTEAEKPQSPVRFSGPHPTPITSSEETSYLYKCNKYQPYDERSSVWPECYCERSTNSQDNIPKRDVQVEYDSHKKYRYNSKSNSFDNGKNWGRLEKVRNKSYREIDEMELNDQERLREIQSGRRYNNDDYYNYDRNECKTRSELLREEENRRKTHLPSLQEYLCKNRPDFCNNAERRRQIIAEKAKERSIRHSDRIHCLMNLMHHCNECISSGNAGEKRIFTTAEIRGQTMKRYKKLPEVTGKIADQKKKEEYRTNKLVADIYSKKLQIEALKGRLNLSNSISVLATI